MKPVDPVHNISNVSAADWHVICNRSVAFSIACALPYLIYLIFGKFVHRTFFATIMRSMLQFIQEITRSSVVSQISNVIVGWVSVVMATIHSIRPYSRKSRQNKGMNISCFARSVFVKVNCFSANLVCALAKHFSALHLVWTAIFKCSHSIYSTYISNVRNFVKAFVSRNSFPDFLHVVAPSNAPLIKIHGGQWSNWFSGANLAMNPHFKA